MGNYAAALATFATLENRVKSHMEPDQVITAWRGQASALCQLDRVDEAHAMATAALALAREVGSAEPQVHVLRVFAHIHQKHPLPAPAGMVAPTAALHYLQCALDVAASMDGYAPSSELLNQLALAYADCGDYRSAFETSQKAAYAREKVHAEQTQRRALAVQIHSQVQRAQAETEHHRQLAHSLRETAATLEVLGTIGRAVTASLDAQAVFEALHRHVHELLDATSFAVYLLDRDHNTLNTAFAREAGVDLPVRSIPLDSATSRFARCAREKKELVFHLEPNEVDGLIPGTLATRSLLYSPLLIGERLLGVMTIQSSQHNAYGERERSIFQSLCAYGAIALDNSGAYAIAAASQHRADQALHDLRQTQLRLVEQNQELERLAVTDQLTGLNNRLRLDQTLREERQRQARHGTGFGVLMVDVDHFKAVNDSYGHPVGDQVLVGIARILLQHSRELDVVGRWGGEEFLVICRETNIEGAMALAEKLRQSVQAHVFEVVGRKTLSVGVAVYRPAENLTETLARADAALYRAKQGGRNRVESGESSDTGAAN
jgi:diguanylate cyclase (GGDEF)-like protein